MCLTPSCGCWLAVVQAYGGDNSPYVFMDLEGRASWDVFSEILEKAQVRGTSHHLPACLWRD